MGDGGRGESVDPACADVPPEFVEAAFAQLDAALDVVQGVAWPALSAGEVRATVRGLTARQGAWASARFQGLVAIDARDDVVPKAVPGKASLTFQKQSLGVEHATAKRDTTAAH